MTRKSADDVQGFEYDWLAADAAGRVALFSTAGGGYAPAEFLRDTEAHEAAIDAILAMPASTPARFAPELAPQLPNTWRLMAERGVFAFDSSPHGGPYSLVAAPSIAAHVDDLPEAAAKVARSLALRGLRFAELRSISEELLRTNERTS